MTFTLNARAMQLIGPRNRTADCVLRSLTFLSDIPYDYLEGIVLREQSQYNPDKKTTKGIFVHDLLGDTRIIQGVKFTRIYFSAMTLGAFMHKYNSGKYIACIPRHALSVVDGQLFDACDSPLHKLVEKAWKVEKLLAL